VALNLDALLLANDLWQLEESHGFVELTNQMYASETLRVPFYVVPRPWTRLEVGADIASAPSLTSTLYLTHSGPIPSNLWIYPAHIFDAEDPNQGDEGDIRLVGLDYLFRDDTVGDVFVAALNTWGSAHLPPPLFAELDLYLDVDEDGEPDVNIWNYDKETLAVWYIGTPTVYLASPYPPYYDYNSGYVEWYLPATWNRLDDIGPGANTDFNFFAVGFDYFGNEDETGSASFDIARPPLVLTQPNNPGPDSPNAAATFRVVASGSLGALVTDLNGAPGAGQAYYVFHPFTHLIYLPANISE
jgi:hypothetical protein